MLDGKIQRGESHQSYDRWLARARVAFLGAIQVVSPSCCCRIVDISSVEKLKHRLRFREISLRFRWEELRNQWHVEHVKLCETMWKYVKFQKPPDPSELIRLIHLYNWYTTNQTIRNLPGHSSCCRRLIEYSTHMLPPLLPLPKQSSPTSEPRQGPPMARNCLKILGKTPVPRSSFQIFPGFQTGFHREIQMPEIFEIPGCQHISVPRMDDQGL